MKVLVCIDDTDNLDSLGTGEHALILNEAIENNGWGHCAPVTRHQLFIHKDIPYTSHNSSMCFTAEISEKYLQPLIDYASSYLQTESAPGSDPGLCIAAMEQLTWPELLTGFGQRAKVEVITKQEAYQTAEILGIHLSEHGGTGLGVIGALAGAGLRLTGNDGRNMGKLKFHSQENRATVGEILRQTKMDKVQSLDGVELALDEQVMIAKWFKAILQDSLFVIPVCADEGGWRTCTKQELKDY